MRWWLLIGLGGCDLIFDIEHVDPSTHDAASTDAATDAKTDTGCADGARDGYPDTLRLAGCSGGWELAGVARPRTVDAACATSGDDGANETGRGCSVADLCAAGWHLCRDAADVRAALGATASCASITTSPMFFVAQISGDSQARCNGAGTNDIFGCGTQGAGPPDLVTCAPLDQWSGDLCSGLTIGGWACGVASSLEAANVTKASSSGGGALCCRD